MAELLGEACSVTRRLLRRGLGLQTSRCVNVFFPAKGRILFEQASYRLNQKRKVGIMFFLLTACCILLIIEIINGTKVVKLKVFILKVRIYLLSVSSKCWGG